jgi:hypothetical protein
MSCDGDGDGPGETDPVEDCLTMQDLDKDDKSGCRDEDCLSEPTCQLAYDLYQAVVLEWYQPPYESVEYTDNLLGGRYDIIDPASLQQKVVSVTCAQPGRADFDMHNCGYHDDTGTYTRAWLVESGQGQGKVHLDEQDAFFSITGSWGPEYRDIGYSTGQQEGYATTVHGDLDSDGYADLLLSQPVAAIGDVLYAWYGGEGKNLATTFPDFSLPGRDFTRVRHAGDITGDGHPDVVVTEGPVEAGYAAVVPGGVRYTAQTLQDALETGAISMTHPPEAIDAWAFPGKPADLVYDSRDDFVVVSLCTSHGEEITTDNLCGVDTGGIAVPVVTAGLGAWEDVQDLTAREAWAFHMGGRSFGGYGLPTRTAVDVADLDGDGHDDMLVGMPVANFLDNDEVMTYGSYKGGVLVYGGKEGGWQGQQGFESGGDRVVVLQESSGGSGLDHFGLALVSHDFDGDGYDDVLVWDSDSGRPAIAAEYDERADVEVDIYAGSADFFDRGTVVRPVAVLLNISTGHDDVPQEYEDIPLLHNYTVPAMPEIIGDMDGGGVADIYIAGRGVANIQNLEIGEHWYDLTPPPFAGIWSGERIRDLIVEGKALQEAAR